MPDGNATPFIPHCLSNQSPGQKSRSTCSLILDIFHYITLTILFMSLILVRQSEFKKEVSDEPIFPPTTRMNGFKLGIGSWQEAKQFKKELRSS